MKGMSGPYFVSTRLQRITELSRRSPEMVLTTLAHHIDVPFLHEAWRRTRKDGAPGVDGVTAEAYEADLDANLKELHERFKAGTYKAPSVRRTYIPKEDGRKRPLGIPTLEDKILQRAVSMVLQAVYEPMFYDCSYGFRPERDQHQALDHLRKTLMQWHGGWVLDVDVKGFFDNLSHSQLRSILDQRVRDGVIRRVIDKWLKAGVLEDGAIMFPEKGTPQGGVISPLLSNIFLHEVIDTWFMETVRKHLSGRGELIRFADDFIIVLESRWDADRVLKALVGRLAKYGLQHHPDKTKLVFFCRPSRGGKKPARENRPGTFGFLGFTHYWGKTRNGYWIVQRKTDRKRLKRKLGEIREWCRKNRHQKVKEQHATLSAKLKGHYGYYGVTGNMRSVVKFYRGLLWHWYSWLRRRSQRRHLTWEAFRRKLRANPLPTPCLPKSVYRTQ